MILLQSLYPDNRAEIAMTTKVGNDMPTAILDAFQSGALVLIC